MEWIWMSDTENTLHAHLKAGQFYTHISGHKIDKSHYRWEFRYVCRFNKNINVAIVFSHTNETNDSSLLSKQTYFPPLYFFTFILTSQVNSFSTTAKKWWWQVCLKKVSKKFQKHTGNSTTRLLCWTNI